MHVARFHVIVLVVDVVSLMLVLSALVVVHAVVIAFLEVYCLQMQASTHFPKVRRMLIFHAPSIFQYTFGQLPRFFAGTLLLPLCLFLRPILKSWSVGATLMRFTWANTSERRILVSNFGVTRDSLCEFHTLDWFPHVCALPENRLRRRRVLKYATELPCIR